MRARSYCSKCLLENLHPPESAFHYFLCVTHIMFEISCELKDIAGTVNDVTSVPDVRNFETLSKLNL